jgi:hypothetical protein
VIVGRKDWLRENKSLRFLNHRGLIAENTKRILFRITGFSEFVHGPIF